MVASKRNKNSENESETASSKNLAIYLVPVAIVASLIAWYRNSDRFILIRLFYVVLAYIFNVFYLGYIVYNR